MKKLFLIFSSFLIGLFLFNFLTFKPIVSLSSKNEINLTNAIDKEYVLDQKNDLNDEFSARPIPAVSVKPNTNKYRLVLIKEYLDSFGKYDQLFFASKRIAELEKWGRELDWKKSLDQYKNHVIAYWERINKNDKQIKYPEFKATLQAHYRMLEELIFFQSNNQVKNIQKMQYVDQIFNQFSQLVPNDTIIFTNNSYYPIYNIIKDKEYGIYNISSQINNNYNYLQNIQLLSKDKAYYPQIIDSDDHETKQVLFNNVLIDKSNSQFSAITIKLPEIKNEILNWTESFNIASPNSYAYKTLIKNLNPGQYQINIAYAFKNSASIRIEEQVATTESKLKYRVNSLYQQTIYPHGYSHIFSDFFQKSESNEEILSTFLNIESKIELTPDEINSISLYFTPIIQLELTAHKISELPDIKPIISTNKIRDTEYKITTIDLTYDQDQKILDSLGFGWRVIDQSQNNNQSEYVIFYWVKYVIGFMIVFLVLSIIGVIFYTHERYQTILNYLKSFWKKAVIYPIQSSWRIFQYVCAQIRSVLLFFVIPGLLIDIFIIQGNNNIVILLLTGFWVLILIGYNIEARINFVFALIFLILCLILIILKLDPFAEKSAIWLYIMLIIGTFQLLIEVRFETKGLVKYPVFLKKIIGYPIIQLIVLFIVKVLLNCLNFVSVFTLRIISVFNYLLTILKRINDSKPRSIAELPIYLAKICIVLSLFIIFIVFIF
ncbi:MAG: hypothetical protein Q7R95_05430, partial [bacterium]|nr:hypothetical protein [bacterium]